MLLTFLAITAALAIAAPFLGRAMGRSAGWVLGPALFATGIAFWALVDTTGPAESYPWIPALGVEFGLRADGLSLLFALLVLLIGGIVLVYSAHHLSPAPHGNFYGWMTLFAFAMLGLVLANDVVVMFLMWEITTFCSFFLIARSGPAAREPAIRTLLVTGAGGLSLLAAVVVMAVEVGSTNLTVILMSDAWAQPGFAATVAVLIAIAAFAKSAQFPFQAWLPDAMAAATPVSAYLHAAAMVKAGIFLLMRFSPVLGDVPVWNIMLISVGLFTAILGAMSALRRYDLKSMLAYSTVSQLGFLVATIGIGTPEALFAAAIHTVAHALFKSALFMLTGIIDHRTGTRDIRVLAGLHRAMPVTTVLLGMSALSMAGVPPLVGFISKESMFAAFLEAPGPWWTGPLVGGVAVLAAVFTFAYGAKMLFGIMAGEPMHTSPTEVGPTYLLPVALPALAGVLLGVWGSPIDGLINGAASSASGAVVDKYLTLWHGLNPALWMSVFVIAAGIVMVRQRGRLDAHLSTLTSPFSALRVVDRTRVGLIRLGDRVGDVTRTDSPSRHLGIIIACLVALTAVGAASIGPLPAIVGDPTRPFDWVLVALMAVGALGAMRAKTRVGAVTVIGVVGFSVTLWFFTLGAADVALTQLLVEILTVVVIVLLLQRLPATFRATTRTRRNGAVVLAGAAGVAATVAVFSLTGRRELTPAGEYFVREAKAETGGSNVVNTILVDFRALDTLGEITVLAMAGVAIMVLLSSRTLLPRLSARTRVSEATGMLDSDDSTVFLRALSRWVAPLTLVLSVFFLLRGHSAPGGGFIAALIGGAAVALYYLSARSDAKGRIPLPALALMGGGVALAVATGVAGFAAGSFLRPLHADILGIPLSTALVFDVGVYLVVIGVVVAAFNLLGGPPGTAGARVRRERELAGKKKGGRS